MACTITISVPGCKKDWHRKERPEHNKWGGGCGGRDWGHSESHEWKRDEDSDCHTW